MIESVEIHIAKCNVKQLLRLNEALEMKNNFNVPESIVRFSV